MVPNIEYKKDIRQARKHGASVVLTMTGFLELDKEYLVKKEDNIITIDELK